MSDDVVAAGPVVVAGATVVVVAPGVGAGNDDAGVVTGFGRSVPVELGEGCSLTRPDWAERLFVCKK